MAERDQITGEILSSVSIPSTGSGGGAAIGSQLVEDGGAAYYQQQMPQQPIPPPAQQAPPQEDARVWIEHSRNLEARMQGYKQDAEAYQQLNTWLAEDPQRSQRFKTAIEYAGNPNHPSFRPPQSQNTPPPAAETQAPPAQQQTVRYEIPPELQQLVPVVQTVANRMERIEAYNAGRELQEKMAQMRQQRGAFDETAVLEIAARNNIKNINELDDAYMTWQRYATNARYIDQQRMQQAAPQQRQQPQYQQQQYNQQPQYQPQYQQQAPPQQQQWGPPQQQYQQQYQQAPPPQVGRTIPPPTRSSVGGGGGFAPQQTLRPMNDQARGDHYTQRRNAAMAWAEQNIPQGRN